MGKVLLIDSNNLVHRYHDVMPDARGPVCYTGGLYGLIAGVRKFLLDEPDHDAVVFVVDKGVPSWRFDLCPEYKQQRRDKSPEDQLHYDRYKEQVKHTLQVVGHTGCAYAYAKGWEGDDVIAALTLRRLKHEQITIYSSDRDYIELVDDKRVRLFSPIKKLWEPAAPFYSIERCLDPKQSDNLDGVPGVGKVGAEKAVQCWLFDQEHARPPEQRFTHATGKALADFLLWCEHHAQWGLTQEQVKQIADKDERKAMRAQLEAMGKDAHEACKVAARVVNHQDKIAKNYECTSLRWAAKRCDPAVKMKVYPRDREAFIEMTKTYGLLPLRVDLPSTWPVFERLNNDRLVETPELAAHG